MNEGIYIKETRKQFQLCVSNLICTTPNEFVVVVYCSTHGKLSAVDDIQQQHGVESVQSMLLKG